MIDRRSALIDRRLWGDRRKVYSLDYFLNGGVERRKGDDRRARPERRSKWLRVGPWCSVFPWEQKAQKSGNRPS
jgi:hypothetical protein